MSSRWGRPNLMVLRDRRHLILRRSMNRPFVVLMVKPAHVWSPRLNMLPKKEILSAELLKCSLTAFPSDLVHMFTGTEKLMRCSLKQS